MSDEQGDELEELLAILEKHGVNDSSEQTRLLLKLIVSTPDLRPGHVSGYVSVQYRWQMAYPEGPIVRVVAPGMGRTWDGQPQTDSDRSH